MNTKTYEPYRFFFPLGILFLLWGASVWVPLIWTGDDYPVLAHRYLMLNGFVSCFVGGFLMTAVPKFSQTWPAKSWEVLPLVFFTLMGVFFAYSEHSKEVFLISSIQPLLILIFLVSRIFKRKANPPYSFLFIFVGLALWFISAMLSLFVDEDAFKPLHYEGAICCLILGVGSRLIPGILGHIEIVQSQRSLYERPIPLLKTVPLHFAALIIIFIASYFSPEAMAAYMRGIVVVIIGLYYWRLYRAPQTKTALTWCIWFSAWMILISFILKVLWADGAIHLGHSFFINGIVLLVLLIATRVIQSHGPQQAELENRKRIYLVTFLLFMAACTRVFAFIMPDLYLSHLAYSALMLLLAVVIWSISYLKFIFCLPHK